MTEDATMQGMRYLALAGPTASGKSAAALALARAVTAAGLPGIEIISVDSALVYRGLNIGSAKPTAIERAAVPHHLIDIRDPLQPYSAAEFVRDAQGLIDAIRARGRVPLLVGGTMLYFKALFDGLDTLPPADPSVRAQIEARAAALGWPALHRELTAVDPVTAARLAPGDAQRIQRALEVWLVSGQPMSSFHSGRFDTGAPAVARDHLLVSLEPVDRGWLHARIAQRFEQMLAEGFLDEVRQLRARGDLHAELPAMRCVGYRQAWDRLEDPTHTAWPANAVAATRQLAKRQLTWLRSMPQRHVIACDAPDVLQHWLALALPAVREVAG